MPDFSRFTDEELDLLDESLASGDFSGVPNDLLGKFDRAMKDEPEPGFFDDTGARFGIGWNRLQQGANVLGGDVGWYSDEEVAKNVAANQRDIASYEFETNPDVNRYIRDIGESESFGEIGEQLADNPLMALRSMAAVGAESLPLSGPMIGAGAATYLTGGAAAPLLSALTAGITSGATEYGVSVTESMLEHSMDPNDPNELAKFLQDEEAVSDAKDRARKRGLGVGAFDAISFGVAGRLYGGASSAARSFAGRRTAAGLGAGAELGAQAAAGGAGEATAQALTGEYKPGEIALEAMAEPFGPGAVEPFARVGAAGRVQSREEAEQDAIRKDMEARGQAHRRAGIASLSEKGLYDFERGRLAGPTTDPTLAREQAEQPAISDQSDLVAPRPVGETFGREEPEQPPIKVEKRRPNKIKLEKLPEGIQERIRTSRIRQGKENVDAVVTKEEADGILGKDLADQAFDPRATKVSPERKADTTEPPRPIAVDESDYNAAVRAIQRSGVDLRAIRDSLSEKYTDETSRESALQGVLRALALRGVVRSRDGELERAVNESRPVNPDQIDLQPRATPQEPLPEGTERVFALRPVVSEQRRKTGEKPRWSYEIEGTPANQLFGSKKEALKAGKAAADKRGLDAKPRVFRAGQRIAAVEQAYDQEGYLVGEAVREAYEPQNVQALNRLNTGETYENIEQARQAATPFSSSLEQATEETQTEAQTRFDVWQGENWVPYQVLRNSLEKMGLGDVALRLMNVWTTPEGGFAEGSEQVVDGQAIIRIATDLSNRKGKEQVRYLAGVLNHEVIHALRDLGLFTNKEWTTLTNAAAKRKSSKGGTFLQRAQVQYANASPELQAEESVAEMFREWADKPSTVAGKPASLLRKMVDFFKRVGDWLTGNDIANSEDIMRAIQKGQIGGRERSPTTRTSQIKEKVSQEYTDHAPSDEQIKGMAKAIVKAVNSDEKHSVIDMHPDTRMFRDWFGDSKVTVGGEMDIMGALMGYEIPRDPSEDKKPKVLWHWTRAQEDFDQFHPLSHFGTLQAARDRMEGQGVKDTVPDTFHNMSDNIDEFVVQAAIRNKVVSRTDGPVAMADRAFQWWSDLSETSQTRIMEDFVEHLIKGNRMIPVFLSIENPLITTDIATGHDVMSWVTTLREGTLIHGPILNDEQVSRITFPEDLIRELEAMGYDGVGYINDVEDRGSISWVPFSDTQIGSVFRDWNDPEQVFTEKLSVINLDEEREKREVQKFHHELQQKVKSGVRDLGEVVRLAEQDGIFDGFDVGSRIRTKNGNVYQIVGHTVQRTNPKTLDYATELYKKLKFGEVQLLSHNDNLYRALIVVETPDGQKDRLYVDGLKAQGYETFTGPSPVDFPQPASQKDQNDPEKFSSFDMPESVAETADKLIKAQSPRTLRGAAAETAQSWGQKIFGQVAGETWWQALRRNVIDKAARAYDMDRELAKVRGYGEDVTQLGPNSLGQMLDSAMQTVGRLAHLIDYGNFRVEDPETGYVLPIEESKGYYEIMAPIGQKNKRFFHAYRVAKNELEMRRAGKQSFSDVSNDELQNIIDSAPPEFEQVLREFQEFNRHNLQLAVDAGILSNEKRDALLQFTHVPYYRIMEEEMTTDPGEILGPKMQASLNNPKSALSYMREGGDLVIGDMYENDIRNMESIIRASMRNIALKRVAKHIDELNDAGFTTWGKKLTNPGERKTAKYKMGFYDNGKRVEYRIDDPAMWAMFSAMAPSQSKAVMDIGLKFSSILRDGVTLNPAFMLANLFRGKISAFVISGGSNPFRVDETMKGLMGSLRHDTETAIIQLNTGMGGYTYGQDVGSFAKKIKHRQDLPTILGGEGSKDIFTQSLDILRVMHEKAHRVGEATEMAERHALYKKFVNRGMHPKQAAFEAMNVINFNRRGAGQGYLGSAIAFLVPLIPFLNARIQGLYRLVENQKGNKRFLYTFPADVAMRGGAIFAASTIGYMLSAGDERWDDESKESKLHNHIFYIGDKTIRLPRSFEVGAVFGAMPMLIYDAIRSDEELGDAAEGVYEGISSIFMNTFAFNPIPQAVKPTFEVWTNWNFFTGTPIEGTFYSSLTPERRFDEHTSEIAKSISANMGGALSPLQIDHLITGYLGSIAQNVLSVTDAIAAGAGWSPEKPSGAFGDPTSVTGVTAALTGMKRFYREDWESASQDIRDFYDMKIEATQIERSIKDAIETGNIEWAKRELEENKAPIAMRKMLDKVGRSISDINRQIRNVLLNPNLSANQKHKNLKQLRQMKTKLAGQAARMGKRYGL